MLACAVPGATSAQVAADLGCSLPTVGKWRAGRFVARRLEGLVDEERSGRPSSESLDQVEDVTVTTLESKPRNATHRPQASMAKKSGLSRSTMRPMLEVHADGSPHSQAEVRELVAVMLGVTEAERKELLPSGKQPTYANRVGGPGRISLRLACCTGQPAASARLPTADARFCWITQTASTCASWPGFRNTRSFATAPANVLAEHLKPRAAPATA